MLPLLFESALNRRRKERSLFEQIILGFCCKGRLLLEEVASKGDFSLQQLLKAETKQLSPTHLYSESSQKCPKTITQILQRGRQEYLTRIENLIQAWCKHLCGVQSQLNLCRPILQKCICNESLPIA